MKMKFDLLGFGSAMFAILFLLTVLLAVLILTVIPQMSVIWIFMPFLGPLIFLIGMVLLFGLMCVAFGIRHNRTDRREIPGG